MSSVMIQILALAAIAIFLILRLRNVLGTREGFERPPAQLPTKGRRKDDFEVIEGGLDRDITDNVPENSEAAQALAQMKRVEPSFNVGKFVAGARGAYEMILMSFENGEIAKVKPFLSDEVFEAFSDVVADREKAGLKVEASFGGVRDIQITDAHFDRDSGEGEITIRYLGEITSVVRDAKGKVVEGRADEVRRQKDSWTFARVMGAKDPNWLLVATGE